MTNFVYLPTDLKTNFSEYVINCTSEKKYRSKFELNPESNTASPWSCCDPKMTPEWLFPVPSVKTHDQSPFIIYDMCLAIKQQSGWRNKWTAQHQLTPFPPSLYLTYNHILFKSLWQLLSLPAAERMCNSLHLLWKLTVWQLWLHRRCFGNQSLAVKAFLPV